MTEVVWSYEPDAQAIISTGCDLGPRLSFKNDVYIEPRQTIFIKTGVNVEFPYGNYAKLWASPFLQSLNVELGPALVGSMRIEEIFVRLTNHNDEPVTIPSDKMVILFLCKTSSEFPPKPDDE